MERQKKESYTEPVLVAHEMLRDIEKETVEFGPNYDGSETEPLVLPAAIPNLLINGSSGIAPMYEMGVVNCAHIRFVCASSPG